VISVGTRARGILCLCVVLSMTAGCGSLRHRDPVPADLTVQARVPGIPNARVLVNPNVIDREGLKASLDGAIKRAGRREQPPTLLAISGGGENGAFAAGLLNGWSERGDRPEFDIVTGISTGALIGPLAFLGPKYDDELKEAYTTLTDKDVFKKRSFRRIIRRRDALADSGPLETLIRKHFDEAKMEEVAAEHRKGRRLYVGTTHLDAELLVAWDLGAIASSGHPAAYDLCCDILLASASIPVAFPPVYFEVEADGQTYDEMHVDGGTSSQVFGAYGLALLVRESGKTNGNMYFIRNAHLTPQWKEVKPKLSSIARRSVSLTIKTQGLGDLYRAYVLAQSLGLDFHLVSIPEGFQSEKRDGRMFDPHYMTALFEAGRNMAIAPAMWKNQPPGVRIDE